MLQDGHAAQGDGGKMSTPTVFIFILMYLWNQRFVVRLLFLNVAIFEQRYFTSS